MGSGMRSMARATAVTAIAATAVGASLGSPTLASSDAKAEYAALEELSTEAMDVSDIEATAIRLADQLEAVPVSAEQYDVPCPTDRLQVSWEEPVGYERGALVEPVGPQPGPDTRHVNGVVVCDGSTYAFMGFEAKHNGNFGWRVTAVPVFEGHDFETPEPLELRYLDELEPTLSSLLELGPIDDYAPYEPQRLCHAVPKPGAVALAKLLLDAYPGTSSYGIARDCAHGPRSEHKEGRAFDWGADINNPEQAEAVEDLLKRLLATDADGNEHALARRLGVMYVIWDGHIWSSYRADDGWRPYAGPSAHTDHVHVSLSWDGALGRTSLWRVAIDQFDLTDVELGSLGKLPPQTDGPLRDSFDTRGAVFADRAEEQRARQREANAEDDGTDEGTDETTAGPTDGTPDDGGTGDTVDDTTDTVTDTVDDTADTVEDTVDEVTDPIDDTVDDPTDPVDDTVNDTTDTVDDTVDGAGNTVDDALGGALPLVRRAAL